MNFEKYKYYIGASIVVIIILGVTLYFVLSKKSKPNNPNDGEGFIFSFSSAYLVNSFNIVSPSTGDLSTMPSGISLLGSNTGDKWTVLYKNNSINWNTGSNIFQINETKPYLLFAVVITSLSNSNNGLIGQIQLINNNSPILSDNALYNTSSPGNYISYPGYQFNKIGLGNFSISYTPMITTPSGAITADNIQKLVFSNSPTGTFGILPSNTTYSNGKYNGSSIFKIEN
jgi:hypothetical protein